jgi:prepilin-type N-terminal cleavage/methylation domain-containing protein
VRRRGGFTLVELLVVVGLIGVLAGLLAPACVRSLHRARETPCLSQLHQVALALSMYEADHAGNPPSMLAELAPEYGAPSVLLCPDDHCGGYANALCLGLWQKPDTMPIPWAIDDNTPTSYLYAGSHYSSWEWRSLAETPGTACVVCPLHGQSRQMRRAGTTVLVYTGRMLRAGFDGAARVEQVRAVSYDASLQGGGVSFLPYFEPAVSTGG